MFSFEFRQPIHSIGTVQDCKIDNHVHHVRDIVCQFLLVRFRRHRLLFGSRGDSTKLRNNRFPDHTKSKFAGFRFFISVCVYTHDFPVFCVVCGVENILANTQQKFLNWFTVFEHTYTHVYTREKSCVYTRKYTKKLMFKNRNYDKNRGFQFWKMLKNRKSV